jgi:putative SOS response-associated peptidase YedK
MCYDIKTKLESMLKRAKHYNDQNTIKELEERLKPYFEEEFFHVSGFNHPRLLIYTNEKLHLPSLSVWGLVPSWVKDNEQKKKLWNNTLNARGETIFEKPSFKKSAMNKRCVVYLDGFYEHYHHKGKNYPFFIKRIDNEPMALGGLWDEWLDKATGELLNTFTIVTTKANELMSKIHNNPKLNEPRMPLILDENKVDSWLEAIDQKQIMRMLKAFDKNNLTAHTVRPIKGKNAIGNNSEANMKFNYEELEKEVF